MRVIAPGAAGVPVTADDRHPEVTNAWLSLAHAKIGGADPGSAAPSASSGLPPDRAVRATGCGASAPPSG